jgi:hypothetical protein
MTSVRYFPPILTEGKQDEVDEAKQTTKTKYYNSTQLKRKVRKKKVKKMMMIIITIKLDIIIRDNEKGTCMLIDVAISGDRNVIKKEAENIQKYKDLTIEIQRMWNVKTRVIPVIIGATGTISKSFRKYVSNIPGNHEVKELQKTTMLGTAHIRVLRKVLTSKYHRVNTGTSYTGTINSNNRTAAILYSLGAWFVPRKYV